MRHAATTTTSHPAATIRHATDRDKSREQKRRNRQTAASITDAEWMNQPWLAAIESISAIASGRLAPAKRLAQ